ncbi:MAG: CotH kinase family protein, partial [Candidatus Eiseniibacteriota bacterium]
MRFSDPLPLPAVRASRSLPSSAALVVLAALIALVATALAPSPAAAYEKRLICGTNMAYLDASGHAFYYDLPYTQALGYGRIGGFALADTTAVPFGGTPDRTLYINGRYTWDEYRFDVPNGDYLVRLHFADRVETGPGFRAFDISIEGALVLDDYDVIADAGDPYYVVRPTFAATVTDGQLNVVCTQNTAESHIEAIEVLSWPQEVDPPSTPGGLDAQDSYHRISIDWDDAPEEDVAGYILERSTAAGGPYTPVTAAPIRNSRYHDDDVVLGTPYYYRVAAVDIWDNQSAFSSEVSGLVRADGSSTLPVYEITLDPADYQALLADPLSDEYKHGTFRYQGQVWEDVGVRFRGRISRFLPKKSWKVKFNEFVPGQLFLDGQEELNLNAHHGEQTLLREALAYHVEREAGVPASNARHAHLQLNDTYLGVFTEAEQVDERWLENRGFNSSGNLYKSEDGDLTVLADSLAYTLSYSKKTNRNEGYEDLITFIELINETPPESVYTRLAPVFDIEGWINYYATQIAIGNDSFFSHNYYLYHDLVNDMWHYLPWDLDSTWGHLGAYHAGVVDSVSVLHGLTANGLITQLYQGTLLNSGHYLRRYLDRVLEILEDVMDPVLLDPVIDDYHAKMVTDARLDWHKWGWESSEWVDQGNVELESFLPARAAYVQLRHAALAPPQDLWFNEIMADNDNVIQDEFGDYDDWFELYNAGTVAIDLSGHFMTDDPAQPMQWALPDTTIQPGGFLLFWADGEPLEGPTHTNFRLDYDGEFLGLFAPVADGNYPVETTSWGFQYKNVSVGRYPDGGYNWKLMPNPTPAATNIEGGNLPPDVGDTQRDPLNVGVNVPVTVTTTASDPDGIAAVTLHYDLGTVFESTPMFDDG